MDSANLRPARPDSTSASTYTALLIFDGTKGAKNKSNNHDKKPLSRSVI